MRKAMGETYSNAGILKKTGNGLVMDIAGAEFFVLKEDLSALMRNQMADVVNHEGEEEGLSWLSPLISSRKRDMTALIDHHIYIVNYQEFHRVVQRDQRQTVIKEYHPQELWSARK
ncbi:MAG: hypothetical protein OS112_09380 [Methanoregula sp.]|nr:MAG: hypothetical protein OS112_09380 [Methanoregula sp.]